MTNVTKSVRLVIRSTCLAKVILRYDGKPHCNTFPSLFPSNIYFTSGNFVGLGFSANSILNRRHSPEQLVPQTSWAAKGKKVGYNSDLGPSPDLDWQPMKL